MIRGAPPGSSHRVSDVELASRLSFFLWSSIPDEELLAVAEAGKLGDKAVLAQQVKRMMADPKSEQMVKTSRANGCSCGIFGHLAGNGILPELGREPAPRDGDRDGDAHRQHDAC